jgi:hypothetical protein
MKIYVGQTKLTITLNTGVTLTGVDSVKIKYIKPSKATGELSATTSGTNVVHDVSSNFLDEPGEWRFWAEITWVDTKKSISEGVLVKVYSAGY